jgi:AraC-like DNA-binding protein
MAPTAPLALPLSLRAYGPSPGSHSHLHFQVLLGVSGTLELEVDGKGQRIASGQGCVIAPGQRHDFDARTGAQCVVLDTTSAAWEACGPVPFKPKVARALSQYLQLALQSHNPLVQHVGPSLMLDCWQTPAYVEARRQARAIDWMALSHWCQARLHGPLTVADLAAQACLSPTQFAQRCKLENGQSPMQWVRALRLARAQALRASGWDAERCARQCGYQSASALAAALRKQSARA